MEHLKITDTAGVGRGKGYAECDFTHGKHINVNMNFFKCSKK